MAASRSSSGKNAGGSGKNTSVSELFRRWFLAAPAAMAIALFVTLSFGTWLSVLSKIPLLHFLSDYGAASVAVIGAACGAAIALGLKAAPLTAVSCAVAGAVAYTRGGPLCTYAVCLVSAEVGNLFAEKTKANLVLVPLATLVPGLLLTMLLAKPVSDLCILLGNTLNQAAEMKPFAAGLLLSVLSGLFSLVPLSAGTVTLSLGLEGLAGGAVCAGCSAFMAALAAGSASENGLTGILTVGFGTPMLETPSILRRPQLLIPPLLASAVCGPLSAAVLKISAGADGALGLCGLAGPVSTYNAMTAAGSSPGYTVFCIVLVQLCLPALIGGGMTALMRKAQWIKTGDMKLYRPEL